MNPQVTQQVVEAQIPEEWRTESGLPDDFDFWVEESYFGTVEEYQKGQVVVHVWEGIGPEGSSMRILWPIGEGWTASPDGRYVSHEKKKTFTDTCMYGRLINRAIKNLHVPMYQRGSSKDAFVWKGLGWHMKREKFTFEGLTKIAQDGSEKALSTAHLMPTSFLGERAPGATPIITGSVSVAPEASAGIDVVIEAKLVELAQTKDIRGFQIAALRMPEVQASANITSQILDTGPNGFWAKNQKK